MLDERAYTITSNLDYVTSILCLFCSLQLIGADPLYNDTTRRTATVTDCSSTILANLQLMQQRNQDPAARATKCVTKRNSTAPRVDILVCEPQNLGVRLDDNSESLVELPNRDVLLAQAKEEP